ncbi:MAG: hypothetical protein L0Z62_20360 [Gemmataceae bacterium]|nr:hypothetical protein [Gemmataceae bacterium]
MDIHWMERSNWPRSFRVLPTPSFIWPWIIWQPSKVYALPSRTTFWPTSNGRAAPPRWRAANISPSDAKNPSSRGNGRRQNPFQCPLALYVRTELPEAVLTCALDIDI